MKSRLLIGLFSFAIGLNTALLGMAVFKLEHVERRVDHLANQIEVEPGPDGEPGSGPEIGGRTRGESVLFGLPHIRPEQLGLSPDQEQKVKELRSQWAKEESERRGHMQERMQKLPRLFENGEVNVENLMPMLDAAHEASKERLESLIRLYRAYQDILTPEQQQTFKRLIREDRERHERNMPGRRSRGGRSERDQGSEERRPFLDRFRERRDEMRGERSGEMSGEMRGQMPGMRPGGPSEMGPPPGMAPPPDGMPGGPGSADESFFGVPDGAPPDGGMPPGPPPDGELR